MNKYHVNDFILNESFQRYVLQNRKEDAKYWESWISNHPDSLMIIESAKELLQFISSRKSIKKHHPLSDEVFDKLQNRISSEKRMNKKHPDKIRTMIYWSAASILLIIGVSVAFIKSISVNNQSANDDLYLEVIVPEGQKSQLILPDKTRVWLNSGTVFKYPRKFLSQGRDVFLEGEAFFQVEHNEKIPFIVHLKENLSVKVIGTEFNVKSYSDEKVIETTLVKGSINLIKGDNKNRILQEVNLKPNEKAIFDKEDHQLLISQLVTDKSIQKGRNALSFSEKKKIDKLESITAWKEDELVFDGETFEDIAVKMERWFGLKIQIIDEDLKKERFTGKFSNNETIYQVLEVFNRSEPIQFQSTNTEITITKMKNKPKY